MRDVAISYLQKSFNFIDSLIKNGKKSDIFGNGSSDITFTRSGSFLSLSNDYTIGGVLEYRNVTIPDGISIQGNTFYGDRYSGSVPFFLKVSGTLTVNGSLNMNGTGQQGFSNSGSHDDHDAYYGFGFSDLGYQLPIVDRWSRTISSKDWYNLYNYGKSGGFFNFKTCLVGAGNGQTYKWKRAFKYRYRHAYSCTQLNSGGILSDRSDKACGGGGGFLALYYEDMQNSGDTWVDSVEGSPTFGETFYKNINCNGGGVYTYNRYSQPIRWGGGMMVIAARHIVIGPNGSITCNPSTEASRSVNSPIFSDSDLNSGNIAYLNRPTNVGSILDYNFNKYTTGATDLSGGAGVCFGYKITPEYRKQNR